MFISSYPAASLCDRIGFNSKSNKKLVGTLGVPTNFLFVDYVVLQQGVNGPIQLIQRRGRALGGSLVDVVEHQAVNAAILAKPQKVAFGALFLVAGNVADRYVPAKGSLIKGEKHTFVGIWLPHPKAALSKRCCTLGGIDVFDNEIIKPNASWAAVMVGNDDGMMAVISV